MTTTHPFRIPVADLLKRPGASRAVRVEGALDGLAGSAAAVPAGAPVAVDLVFERVPEGIVVRGEVAARWEAPCGRCLAPVQGALAVHVDELYEPHPLEGETYQLDVDVVDLEPLVRDAVLLELPAAPLCRDDCAGLCATCGADLNTDRCDCTHEDLDPRWAPLRQLDLSPGEGADRWPSRSGR